MKKIVATAAVLLTLGFPATASADTNTDPTQPQPSSRQQRQAALNEGGFLRNSRVWIGGPRIEGPAVNEAYLENPNTVEVWSWTPLNAILWAKPFFPRVWERFDSRLQTRCFFGTSTVLGPYGTYKRYKNSGGCTP